jgi:hypothetical protein
MMKELFYRIVFFCMVTAAVNFVFAGNGETSLPDDGEGEVAEESQVCRELREKIRQLQDNIEELKVVNYSIKLQIHDARKEENLNKSRQNLTQDMLKNVQKRHSNYLVHAREIETYERDRLSQTERFYEYIVHPMPEDCLQSAWAAKSTTWTMIVDGRSAYSRMQHLKTQTGLLHGLILFRTRPANDKLTLYLLKLRSSGRGQPANSYSVDSIMPLELYPHENGYCEKVFERPLVFNDGDIIALLLPKEMNGLNNVGAPGGEGDYFIAVDEKTAESIVENAREPEKVGGIELNLGNKARARKFTFSLFGVVRE